MLTDPEFYEFLTATDHFRWFMFWQIGIILSSMLIGSILTVFFFLKSAHKVLDEKHTDEDWSM